MLLALALASLVAYGQNRPEGAHRIRKVQFPQEAHQLLQTHISGARHLQYYREITDAGAGYAAGFRKGRLLYRINFRADGALEQAGFRIGPVDLPQEAWARIQAWLNGRFPNNRVKTIWQAYPRLAFDSEATSFRLAFQNLLVPELRYAIVLKARTPDERGTFRAIFDSEGNFQELLEVTPPDHEHVLY